MKTEVKIRAGNLSAAKQMQTQKFVFFNSGLVPVAWYERDISLIDRVKPQSIRLDLFMGNRTTEFGNLVDGTLSHITYHFEKFDALIRLLLEHGIAPYISWCYNPLPLQSGQKDFRSFPVSLEKYYEVIRTLSAHLKSLVGNGLYYEEVYNEPDCFDVFFTEPYDQFLKLYEYGTKAIRDAGSTALVGGPAEAYVLPQAEAEQNMRQFLRFVTEKNLPLDFFSFHSYGYEKREYLTRCDQVQALLTEYGRIGKTELHLNELNAVPAPWDFGKTILETEKMVPLLFTMIEELLEKQALTLVHWAQLLSSGVDALSVIGKEGQLIPAFFVFELFRRMASCRLEAETGKAVGCLASADDDKLTIIIWNKTDRQQEIQVALDLGGKTPVQMSAYQLNHLFFQKLAQKPQLSLQEAAVSSSFLRERRPWRLDPCAVSFLEVLFGKKEGGM